MARNKKFSLPLTVFLSVLCLGVGLLVGYVAAGVYDALTFKSDEAPRMYVEGDFQIHFLELGNKYTGDCTYIKAGDTDILIDAGSKGSSIPTITEYIDQYVTDGVLEYVIVTHAHEDHYAGFAQANGSIFDLYECGTIIDFALTNQKAENASGNKTMYGHYLSERAAEIEAGAKHYTAAECVDNEELNTFELGSGVTLRILDSYFYTEKATTENDYSVCCLFEYGDYRYLFTGDLEEAGEEWLVELNPEALATPVTLYKAGHHGSKTSSCENLMAKIKPEIVCVCCCCGSSEYTDKNENQFPTQAFIDRVAPYTDRVYVTTMIVDDEAGTFQSMNGNIVVVTSNDGVEVVCSNDSRVLKEWEWFKQKRTCPEAWK